MSERQTKKYKDVEMKYLRTYRRYEGQKEKCYPLSRSFIFKQFFFAFLSNLSFALFAYLLILFQIRYIALGLGLLISLFNVFGNL